jgi:hypothetical protein
MARLVVPGPVVDVRFAITPSPPHDRLDGRWDCGGG